MTLSGQSDGELRSDVAAAYELTKRAYAIECPTCGALPHFKCLTKNGFPTIHKARKDAARAEIR